MRFGIEAFKNPRRTERAPKDTTVLIVDDEPQVRLTTSRILRYGGGYVVFEAGNGPDALELTNERTFDLAVMDVVMPDVSGDELVGRIRKRQPDLKVLYLTGSVDTLFDNRGKLWEAEAFLEKPFTKTGLLQAVSLALTGHL